MLYKTRMRIFYILKFVDYAFRHHVKHILNFQATEKIIREVMHQKNMLFAKQESPAGKK